MALNVVLSTAYFPPVQYFSAILFSENIYIEAHENYSRQSYRNRCNILSCNGILPLSIPVIKPINKKENICNIKIDYSANWQRIHLNAITSAYGKSPYFFYYSENLLHIIKHKTNFLFDLNMELIKVILKILNQDKKIVKTTSFIKEYSKDNLDLRYVIHPKITTHKGFSLVNNKPYIQTFSDRFNFIPDLSILDLIFNLGPDSVGYLNTCSKLY